MTFTLTTWYGSVTFSRPSFIPPPEIKRYFGNKPLSLSEYKEMANKVSFALNQTPGDKSKERKSQEEIIANKAMIRYFPVPKIEEGLTEYKFIEGKDTQPMKEKLISYLKNEGFFESDGGVFIGVEDRELVMV